MNQDISEERYQQLKAISRREMEAMHEALTNDADAGAHLPPKVYLHECFEFSTKWGLQQLEQELKYASILPMKLPCGGWL